MRRNLIEGRTIDHHAPWKKHYLLYSFITFLFTVLAGVSAIIPFVQLVKMETKTLPESISLDLPIVRLADVEKNSAMVRYEIFLEDDNVDWGNYYLYNWSPLAPIQYETNEYGVIPGETWKGGSGEYSPSIYTQAYQLTIPALSDNMISELIEKYKYDYEEDFVEIDHQELDLLIVYVQEDLKQVFASKGKAVMYVRYFGYADINSVIENTVERITLISD